MKPNIKKLSILGLAGIFLLSVMLCCCFTDVVKAEEPALSCHQTTHDAESSQNTEECDCDQSLVTAKKITFSKDSFLRLNFDC